MSEPPPLLDLRRHRDREGVARFGPWARRAVVGLVAAVSVLGLLNVFGQRPVTTVVHSPAATLKLYAPEHLRSGLLWSARFHVFAHRELKDATLVLDPGWLEGMSLNTLEPSPLAQASRDGRLAFELGHVAKGRSYILFLQFQANATNVAWRRPQDVELDDGPQRLLVLHHHVTIYP